MTAHNTHIMTFIILLNVSYETSYASNKCDQGYNNLNKTEKQFDKRRQN